MPKLIYDIIPPKGYHQEAPMKKEKSSASSAVVKIVALLMVVALNWGGLSAVYETLAYLNDTEDTTNNSFVAGTLDFALLASEDFTPFTNPSFVYSSKPNTAYIDNSTTSVANLLCSSSAISVDTSDGEDHYIYLNWNLGEDISGYESADYFNLKLQHKEDTTIIKVELKNAVGGWIPVCDPNESGFFNWTTCDLSPYVDILKDVSPNVELRIVAEKTGNCHEYLKCAKLEAKLYDSEDPSTRTIRVVNYGNIPQYAVSIASSTGALCPYLNAQASLDGVDVGYNGLLTDFTAGPVVFEEPEEWVFTLSLLSAVPTSVLGESCDFDFVFFGSQIKNDLPLGQGFNDTELVSNTITLQSAAEVLAGILINEFLPNPVGWDIAHKPHGEWVELYNNSGADVDVAGWRLYDEENSHALPITNFNTNTGNTLIPSSGFLVIYRNGDWDFALDNIGGDSVRLYDGPIATGNLIDSHTYAVNAPAGKSFARIPSGSTNWVDPIPTPGEPNVLEGEDIVFGPAVAEPGEGTEKAVEVLPETCEINGANRSCSSQIGACRIGVQICTNGFWGECIGAVFLQEEMLDEVDNNCDGQIDEGLEKNPEEPLLQIEAEIEETNYNDEVSEDDASTLSELLGSEELPLEIAEIITEEKVIEITTSTEETSTTTTDNAETQEEGIIEEINEIIGGLVDKIVEEILPDEPSDEVILSEDTPVIDGIPAMQETLTTEELVVEEAPAIEEQPVIVPDNNSSLQGEPEESDGGNADHNNPEDNLSE